MAQEIKNRRGDLVISIPDGVVLMPSDPTVSSDGPTLANNNTSLFQVGRDVLDYGLEISENLHWLMENFANNVPPQNPVDGQTWWDLSNSTSPSMKVYNTSTGGWAPLVKLASDSNPTLSANMNANSRKIINLTDPTSAQDAATKNYVDSLIAGAGGGSDTFLGLIDTPNTYVGQVGKVAQVNSSASGLQFAKLNFTDLNGVPSSFIGQAGKYLRIDTSGSAIEYVTPNISNIDWTSAVNINAQGTRINNIGYPDTLDDAVNGSWVLNTIGAILPANNGIVVRTSPSTTVGRSIISGNAALVISNADGVAGNITISHSTSTGVSSINSGSRVIQSITLDAYGHVTNIATADVGGGTGFVLKTGDTMSGSLSVSGSGTASINPSGDITASRAGGTTGALFLGSSGSKYLYYDGTNYIMPGSNIYANGGVVWSATNQGPGTGMNSDLLDGYDWHSLQDVDFGIGHFRTPNFGTTGGVRIFANPNHRNAIIQFLTSSEPYNELGFLSISENDHVLRFNNGKIWTEFNDGHTSGLDADTLDGLHASDMLSINTFTGGNQSLSGNGYQSLPGGLILQWGTVYTPANRNSLGNFPIAFPNACFSAVMNGVGELGQFGGQGGDPTIYAFNNSTFYWHSGDDNGCNAFYIAVGI